MFSVEEWIDATPADKVVHTAVKTEQLGQKPKPVSKHCLQRTLRTLGSVPKWEYTKPSEETDGEVDEVPANQAKKKKKRCKKRKKISELETEDLQPDQVVGSGTPEKGHHLKPKRKKQENATSEETKHPEAVTKSTGDTTEKQLSRQQWRNKMKNKRRSKNKFLNGSAGGAAIKQVPRESPPAEETESVQTEKCTMKNGKNIIRKEMQGTKKANVSTVKASKLNSRNQPKKQNVEKVPETSPFQAKKEKILLNNSECSKKLIEEETTVAEESNKEDRIPMDRSTALRSRMEKRLESARFRYINQLLYTSTSGEAKRMFKQDPDAVNIYHKGYAAQVKLWPANPVDSIISFIKKKSSALIVADFGCGDCKIARSVKNKVHCFDLAPVCDLVTVCDMANVPLADSSVDIAVFCLSLMGTNLTEFLAEANRVLVMGGVLKIAEVASRFDNTRSFNGILARLGFKLVSKDTDNSHFFSFEFIKTENTSDKVKKITMELKPCLYKKR